jgi:hypothetical protein
MLDFEQYVARLGEFGVQALIERLERYEGIRVSIDMSLETRWVALMGNGIASPRSQQQYLAA